MTLPEVTSPINFDRNLKGAALTVEKLFEPIKLLLIHYNVYNQKNTNQKSSRTIGWDGFRVRTLAKDIVNHERTLYVE